ncbi:MAG: dienelactone hydrolase family protein, partial [Chloroflexota bacterium]
MTLAEWQTRRDGIREQLWALLGDLPPRPEKITTETRAESKIDHYHRHDFYLLDNEAGVKIPAVFLTSKVAMPPYPVVLYLHAHGGRYELGKDEIFRPRAGGFIPADELTKHGFSVMCIDAYAFEERQHPDEMTLFKRFLWEGKTLWGMMLRDDLMALDYLHSHPEVDSSRIATMGMSMGSTRAFWLAALDERVYTTVAVA